MDIKEKLTSLVEETVAKLKNDPELLGQFQKEPVAALEKLLGRDLPDEQIEKLVTLVKAKLGKDQLADTADNLKSALGGLFGKK